MKEVLQQVLDQVRGIWRFRTQAVLAAWIAGIVLILVVLAWPDSYRATARVYVDTSTALRPLLSGLAVEQDIEARMNIVREQMLGADKLERVSLAAKLYEPNSDSKLKAQVHSKLADSVIIDMTLPTSARRDRAPTADRIFSITYENSDRQKALTVVDTLLKSLVDDTQGSTTAGSEDAREFLRQQIADYEKRLGEAESRLADFKKGTSAWSRARARATSSRACSPRWPSRRGPRPRSSSPRAAARSCSVSCAANSHSRPAPAPWVRSRVAPTAPARWTPPRASPRRRRASTSC